MSKNYFWKFVRSLANLNFAIFILLIISMFCVLGSILEQDQDISYYDLNYPNYKFIITVFGLDHIFQTWWFIIFLFILIISLMSCTFSTQLPSLKNARRWKFIYKKTSSQVSRNFFDDISKSKSSFTNLIYSLLRLNFFIFYRSTSIYSYKGLYGRVAPIFVHFSIVAILLGSLFSLFDSFVVQEIVPKGEIFHFKNIVHAGFSSCLPSDLMLRVSNFFIDYNFDGSIKQFFSSLSISVDNHYIIDNKIISVNDPLRFNSITVYQTDWQINALRIRLGDKYIIQKKLLKTVVSGKNCWLSTLAINDKDSVFFVLFNLDSPILICNSNGLLLNKVDVNDKFYVNNVPIIVDEVITSTGLQIKVDPGIFIVYSGFFVMILSTFLSYVSYSQVWVYCNINSLNFLGSTNRASLFFEQDIKYLEKIYYYYTVCYNDQVLNINNILL
uniref:Cytochrome c biogenesis protein Ccs1 n=1 Tax=Herposiphonia versicolor TaxID=2007163 RepID=A0A1Z1MFN3_9FLOR|nr:cytochrome c biogenesis protein ccs1 [Herposiphonia versicolor]ARW64699.1 cytochrome c biogenesis protein ccs1 [Herposiphonia versicolor]